MPDLDNTWRKIERADSHIAELKGEMDTFWEQEPYFVTKEDDPDEFTDSFLLHVGKEPPPLWGIIAGEIVHNLRSALDNLAWSLALLEPHKPSDATEFPIFFEEKRFLAESPKKIKSLPLTSLSIIEGFQPYHRVERPNTLLLWYIHEFSNFDKHRAITPVYGQWKAQIGFDQVKYLGRFKDRDHIYINWASKGKNQFPIKIGADIFFYVVRNRVMEINASELDSAYKFIRNEVVPSFSHFFH